MYIERKLSNDLAQWLESEHHPNIAVISGVVGCGKTTLVENFLRSDKLLTGRQIFSFSLDDVTLRRRIAGDSEFFLNYVASRLSTGKKALCFVDEVQKSEAVFDAIKVAWDKGIDFIVSGSNPEYLETQASMRLQRRSVRFDLKPLSLPEILNQGGLIGSDFSLERNEDLFFSILDGSADLSDVQNYLSTLSFGPLDAILPICSRYWLHGGLPKAHLAKTLTQSFAHIQASVERGFAPILQDTIDIFDIVTVELASSSGREFSYENFFQRTRTKNRDKINQVISKLLAHGYIKAKRPYIPDGRASYFVSYSFIDPGMISYLTDARETNSEREGAVIESYINARLDNILQLRPRKASLAYFKPYSIKDSGQKNELRFKPGEIDFVVYFGALSSRKSAGLEVKRAVDVANDSLTTLLDAMTQKIIKRGIVLYGGMPRVDEERKLIFWPWWLV
jgi:predicted AAA+ superfamily ATPase